MASRGGNSISGEQIVMPSGRSINQGGRPLKAEESRESGPATLPDGTVMERRSASGRMSDKEREEIRKKLTVTYEGTISNIKENIDLNIRPQGRLALIKFDGKMVFLSVPSFNEVLKLSGKKVKLTGVISGMPITYDGKKYDLIRVTNLADIEVLD